MRSAPAFATARTSSPSRAKSADRMLGAMRNVMAAASLQCRHGAGEAPRHRGERSEAAQLISRHWIITDAQGLVQEVRGLGVVGAQPLLEPGESFEYTSGASIATPVGTMRGSYQMVAADGTRFEAPIPEFTLSVPRVLH